MRSIYEFEKNNYGRNESFTPRIGAHMSACAITMLKNEMCILPAWLAHADILFDKIYAVDHASEDGTAQFLADHSSGKVRLFHYRGKDFPKKQLLDSVLKLALDETHADWFFFLDPDEFLPDADKESFHKRLASVSQEALVMRWRNCFLDDPGFPTPTMRGFRQRRISNVKKIAIRRELASDESHNLSFGAHEIQKAGLKVPLGDFGELLHFPIRSLENAWRKAVRGSLTWARARKRDASWAGHWHYLRSLDDLMTNASWRAAAGLVVDYGDPRHTKVGTDPIEAFEPTEFKLAGVSTCGLGHDRQNPSRLLPVDKAIKLPEIFELAKELIQMGVQQNVNPQFEVTVNSELMHILDWREKTFPKLSEGSTPSINRFSVYSCLQAAFGEIVHPVASAWREHIPFMYALVNLLKPRRFVELGVHHGASFLAACQEIEKLGISSECIAVDTWEGDPHAGRYEEAVFSRLIQKLQNYRAFAGYLRMRFDEAAEKFEDGSVDLLHIDGLHTAAAVAHDFEVWRPKLSRQGVVLFHDINEFRSDFGVWRVWRELKEQFPHIEFGHGHGLGILIVGEESPLRRPVEGWGLSLTDADTEEFSQILFGNLGKLAWSVANINAPSVADFAQSQVTASQTKRRRGLRKVFWKVKRTIWKDHKRLA